MDLAVAQESGFLQAGNHAENARLLRKFQMVLKTNDVVTISAQVLLAELYDRIGPLTGPRIDQSNRLHRSKAQCVATATSDLLYRKTSLKVVQVLPVV
jgi:hypothetical protein